MRAVLVIAKKELSTFFDSLIAYVLLILFLGFTGAFTWLFFRDVFYQEQASLSAFFDTAYFSLFIFAPALTMGMIAEERKTGTIELLLTKSVTDWQVLLGKFFAALSLIGIALLLSLPYYITVANIGDVDHGAIICGYLGLFFMSACYVSIGLMASSVTNNQIVSLLLALAIGICFHGLFKFLSIGLDGPISSFFLSLSMGAHVDSLARGVIDSRDLLYFFSITAAGLLVSHYSLSKRSLAD